VLKHIDEINQDQERSIKVRQIKYLKNIVEQAQFAWLVVLLGQYFS